MITHPARRPTHYGQLLASAVALCSLTDAVVWSVRGVDRGAPNAPETAAASLVLWLFSIVWAAIAVACTIDGLLHARKTPQHHKPAPGSGSRAESWSPSELAAADAAWRNHRQADEWVADEPADVPAVDPDAARRPRDANETLLAEARHARREAEKAAA